jgi:ketosteroid isomerase-like protein
LTGEYTDLAAIERCRLAAFVSKDMARLRELHASDFQLINPAGQQLSRDDYLNGVAAGLIDYKVWEPESEIQVRLYGDAAAIRYRARLEITVRGDPQPLQHFWHSDLYEKREGRWQVVWSQATRISV